jgi:hypothetical protein
MTAMIIVSLWLYVAGGMAVILLAREEDHRWPCELQQFCVLVAWPLVLSYGAVVLACDRFKSWRRGVRG